MTDQIDEKLARYDQQVAAQIKYLDETDQEIHIPKKGSPWFCKSRRKERKLHFFSK
jgi:hypothetical protein